MHKAMQKLQCYEGIDHTNIQDISITTHKYFEGMRERYDQRLKMLGGWKPPEDPVEYNDLEMHEKAQIVMRNLAELKRVNYGR